MKLWKNDIPLRRLSSDTFDMDPKYDNETIYVSRVSDFDPQMAQATYPNRHTFYEILWATGGQGSHYIDFVEYDVRANTLFFITPGQVHFWDLTEPLEGVFVMFEPAFFHLHHPDPNFMYQFDYFHRTDTLPLIHVAPDQVEKYDDLAEKMLDEFYNPRAGQKTVLSGLLQLFLTYARRDYVSLEYEADMVRECIIANQFQNLLSENYLHLQSVSDYADMLHVSTSYLTRVIKENTGLTAGELIRQRIILAAKRLLVHTNRTVAEIAYELNFTDPSYFSRFFKREVHLSPLEFRRDFREKIPLV